MTYTRKLFAFLLFSFTAHQAHAEDTPKQIQEIVHSGATIVKTFPAAGQMKGWVIAKDGRHMLIYSSADNQTLFVGDLIDAAGNNLTEQYAEQYIPKPDLTPLFNALEKSAYISEGTLQAPKSIIYAFFDPNCPFCHFAWQALQHYESAGLQVRWIPVAYLMETSTGKAAAILQAKNPLQALRDNEQKYDLKNHSGGIKPVKIIPDTQNTLAANSHLMQQFGISGTPALVWKDAEGKIRIKGGMPRLAELPAITGLPEQNIDEPQLARFR